MIIVKFNYYKNSLNCECEVLDEFVTHVDPKTSVLDIVEVFYSKEKKQVQEVFNLKQPYTCAIAYCVPLKLYLIGEAPWSSGEH